MQQLIKDNMALYDNKDYLCLYEDKYIPHRDIEDLIL